MRSSKQSDSPSGYARDVYPSRSVRQLADHENEVRRRTDDRWWTRMDALLPVILADAIEDPDFPGCVF